MVSDSSLEKWPMALDQLVLLCSLVSDDVGSIIKIHCTAQLASECGRGLTETRPLGLPSISRC